MARTTDNPMLLLSAREERVQTLLSQHHRAMVAQFMREQYESSVADDETCGVFLSGGIDSGSMIFSLIEDCDKTIHDTYTAVIESPDPDKEFIESADYLRAKKISEYYGIAHHPVVIKRSPDDVCRRMAQIAEYPLHDNWLTSRSDFEVMVMYFACVEAAAERHNSTLFSGLLDGNLHMTSRKISVANKKRATAFGHYRMAIEPMSNLSLVPGQAQVITQKCAEHDMTIHLSHSSIAAQYPYMYLPWRVLNRPRDKWISIMAYSDCYLKSTGNAYPKTMAMQTGDSGAREFFDEMVRESSVSDEIVGKKTTTSKVFTNKLARISRTHFKGQRDEDERFFMDTDTQIPDDAYDDAEAANKDSALIERMQNVYGDGKAPIRWLEYLTCGGEKPGTVAQIDDETGRATLDEIPDDLDSRPLKYIGDAVLRERFYTNEDEADENGNSFTDDRVDCLGSPLHRGPAFANTECPRARAGLCGHTSVESDDEKPEFHQCTVSDTWGISTAKTIWNFPYRGEKNEEINHEWAASSVETLMLMRTGFASFIKGQENFFL